MANKSRTFRFKIDADKFPDVCKMLDDTALVFRGDITAHALRRYQKELTNNFDKTTEIKKVAPLNKESNKSKTFGFGEEEYTDPA